MLGAVGAFRGVEKFYSLLADVTDPHRKCTLDRIGKIDGRAKCLLQIQRKADTQRVCIAGFVRREGIVVVIARVGQRGVD